ncbi:MAG TPA: glycosyltransferase family 39 protein [Pyrinomonadaceae bacterium]
MAFALRLLPRLSTRDGDYLETGYSLFYHVTESLLSGRGFCVDNWMGVKCALWPPVYPLFLAVATLGGRFGWTVVIAQALIGTGTAFISYLLAKHLFGERVGLIALLITSVYPYYVWHDASLQETSLFTFLTALSVLLLIETGLKRRAWLSALAGVCLALSLLTRASLAPFIVVALAWLLYTAGLRNTLPALIGFCLVVSPWIIRNEILFGRLVLTSQAGHFLWIANNPDTFSRYPSASIDESEGVAWDHLSKAEQENILALGEMEQSDRFKDMGVAYIREHPTETISNGLKKNLAGFSPVVNPSKGRMATIVNFASYFPVQMLGLVGLLMKRRRPETLLVLGLALSFMLLTGIFWAHTGHRSVLDVYFIVFASPVILSLWEMVKGSYGTKQRPEIETHVPEYDETLT